jgi:uncharacterized protein (DUF433 family)
MAFIAEAEAPPLRDSGDGALRVGESRVLLELVIRAFKDGATPETIVQRYPTLALADVYAVITYFLRHRDVVEEYLLLRENKAQEVQQRVATHGDLNGIRARLAAQRKN